jgi:uncharacterized membrane protein (UPF0127 family)
MIGDPLYLESLTCRSFLLGLLLFLLPGSLPARTSKATFFRAVFETGASLSLETVDQEKDRRKGMMYRKEADEGWGMLFVFARPAPLSFWMRNTFVPLSIAYLSEQGEILNIEAMRPLDETTRHPSRGKALYAIEVRQGWFRKHGIRAGQRVQFLRKRLLAGESPPRMPGADNLVRPELRRPVQPSAFPERQTISREPPRVESPRKGGGK